MASKRKSTATIITRSKKLKPCSVGTCGDVDEYNLCRFRRPPGVNVNKFEFNPTRNNDGISEFKTLGTRFFSFPLFQENPRFDQIKILDFSLKLNLTSYHLSDVADTINVPGKITKLLSLLKIDLYLVRICDLELAKKKEFVLSDIIKDSKFIKDHQLKGKIDPIMHHLVVIPCSSNCLFQSHEITMC